MKKETGTITAKGMYRHSQIEQFISIKEYMFVQREGSKYLIVRYTNDMNTTIDTMRFILTEMNADGDVIAVRRIEQKNLRADAGATFAPNEGIPISDDCMDFTIKFEQASSDVYTYRPRGRKVCVYYTPPKKRRIKPPAGSDEFTVKNLRRPTSRSVTLKVIFVLLVFIAASVAVSYAQYIVDYNRRHGLSNFVSQITESYCETMEL